MEPRWLMHTALTNAAMVVLLAALALVVGRRVRRPALTHALWLLVLIRFVTPPLVAVPVPSEWLPESLTGFARTYLVGADSDEVELQPDSPQPSRPVSPAAEIGQVEGVTGPTAALTPARSDVASRVRHSEFNAPRALLLIGMAGTCVYLLWVGLRIVHFQLRLRTRAVRLFEADARATGIARELGLARAPAVMLIAQPCSPMLWGLGPLTRIVFPAVLWNQLSPAARDALLTHELAHYRRRDHWVRPLEILATGLFWWHPVVWWARREIETAEEACCDAWVVHQAPASPRTYAEALLATVDYIASDSPSAVPAATGIGGAPDLQIRLRRIMGASDSPALPGFGRWLLCAAALLLPLHPLIVASTYATTLASHDVERPANSMTIPVADESSPPPVTEPDPQADGPGPTGWWTWAPEERWAVAESADGRFRLLAVTGNRVFLEDRLTGRRTDLSREQITAASFAPDSMHYVTASLDGAIRLWDAEAGEAQSLLGLHDAEIASVDVSPTGEIAASGSRDGALLIWDLGAEVVRATWTESRRPIVSVRISSDGRTIAVASGDWRSSESARITLLNLQSQSVEPAGVLQLPEPVAAIEFAPGENALLAAAWNGSVVRWDFVAGISVPVGEVDRSVVNAATFSPDVRFADRIRRPPPAPSPLIPEWAQFGERPLTPPAPPLNGRTNGLGTLPDEFR